METIGIVVGSIGADSLYSVAAGARADLDVFASVGGVGALIYVSLIYSAGLYDFPEITRPMEHLGRIAATCSVSICAVTAMMYLFKVSSEVSRGSTLLYAVSMLLTCWGVRCGAASLVKALLDRRIIVGRPVQLVGVAEELAALRPDYLLRRYGFSECGRCVLRSAVFQDEGEAGVAIRGALDGAQGSRAEHILLALKPEHLDRLHKLEGQLRSSPLPTSLLPSLTLRAIEERHGASARPSLLLVVRAPFTTFEQGSKRIVDIVGALTGLILLSPIFLIVALAVKLDSAGPAIFWQQRNGFNQRPFWIMKFRTMFVQEDGDVVPQARRNDRRITRTGRFLRRSSIDELPQLINVLQGHMSLVGPRPHALAHDTHYGREIGDYYRRHHVKPGITGWAQINGLRGETAAMAQMERRIDYDVWYVNNWSLLLDLKIIVRTCLELTAHDAY